MFDIVRTKKYTEERDEKPTIKQIKKDIKHRLSSMQKELFEIAEDDQIKQSIANNENIIIEGNFNLVYSTTSDDEANQDQIPQTTL